VIVFEAGNKGFVRSDCFSLHL